MYSIKVLCQPKIPQYNLPVTLRKHHGRPLELVGLQQHPLALHCSPEMPRYPHLVLSDGSVWHCAPSAVGTNIAAVPNQPYKSATWKT